MEILDQIGDSLELKTGVRLSNVSFCILSKISALAEIRLLCRTETDPKFRWHTYYDNLNFRAQTKNYIKYYYVRSYRQNNGSLNSDFASILSLSLKWLSNGSFVLSIVD